MEVVDDLSRCPRPSTGTVVTIGAYDGVHLGHRRLIARVRELAAERRCASAVVTFDRHPALVVRPESAPRLLTDLPTRLELLAVTGLDYAVVVPFDQARANEPAEDFVRGVLVGCLTARVVVVGHDFHFGHNREGNVDLLRRIGPGLGFEVQGLALFDDDVGGGAVSSTRVRKLLQDGDASAAAALLGRPHRLSGAVSATDGSGDVLLRVADEYLVPADGRYAGWYTPAGGQRAAAVVEVPARGSHQVLAVHLADVSAGDGEGVDTRPVEVRTATVEFTERLGVRS